MVGRRVTESAKRPPALGLSSVGGARFALLALRRQNPGLAGWVERHETYLGLRFIASQGDHASLVLVARIGAKDLFPARKHRLDELSAARAVLQRMKGHRDRIA